MDMQRWDATLGHIGIPTGDLEGSIAFYQGLGFSLAWRSEDGGVAFVELGSLMLELYPGAKPCGKAGAIDHMAISVSDIEAVYTAVSAGGYTLLDDGVRALPFWAHGIRFFSILGPNGEILEFCQRLGREENP